MLETDHRTGLARIKPILVLRTLWAMIQKCDEQAQNTDQEQNTSADIDQNSVLDSDQEEGNFPDLIPRVQTLQNQNRSSTNLESIFLLSLFFGTWILLYLFPPADP